MRMKFDQYLVTFVFDNTKAIGYHYDRKIPYIGDDERIIFRTKNVCSTRKIDECKESQKDIESDMAVYDGEYAISGGMIKSAMMQALRIGKRENPAALNSVDRYTIDRHILTGEFIEIDARKVFDHEINHTISIDDCTRTYKDTVYRIYPKSCSFVLCNVYFDQNERGMDMETIKALLDSIVEHNICNIVKYTINPRNTEIL